MFGKGYKQLYGPLCKFHGIENKPQFCFLDRDLINTKMLSEKPEFTIHHESESIHVKRLLTTENYKEIMRKIEKLNLTLFKPKVVTTIFDKYFSRYLWQKIETYLKTKISERHITVRPFGMLETLVGEWNFTGIHDGFVVHKQVQKTGVKRETPLCVNGNHRSAYTVFVCLHGEIKIKLHSTRSPFSENKYGHRATISLIHEMKVRKKKNLISTSSIALKPGDAVIFKQDLIYELTPSFESIDNGKTYLINAEIMLGRTYDVARNLESNPLECMYHVDESTLQQANDDKHFNVVFPNFKASDETAFFDSLHKAIRNEIKPANVKEHLEKCLFLSYKFLETPLRLTKEDQNMIPFTTSVTKERKFSEDFLTNSSYLDYFPIEIWLLIISYISDLRSLRRLVKVFPGLSIFTVYLLIPPLVKQEKSKITFNLDHSKTCWLFKQNKKLARKVMMAYSTVLLGEGLSSDYYLVSFSDGIAKELELCDFLLSFLVKEELASLGDIFKVKQHNPDRKDPNRDLYLSVDRQFMVRFYNMQYFGLDLGSHGCRSFRINHDDSCSGCGGSNCGKSIDYSCSSVPIIEIYGNERYHTLGFGVDVYTLEKHLNLKINQIENEKNPGKDSSYLKLYLNHRVYSSE